MELQGPTDPPTSAPPERMVAAFVDFQRETMIWKASDLSLEQLTWAYEPATMSLLGMIKHLAYVERSWFQKVLAGLEVDVPWTKDDPDAHWRIESDEDADSIRALYWGEIGKSRAIAASMTWDEVAKDDEANRDGITLGWVLTHVPDVPDMIVSDIRMPRPHRLAMMERVWTDGLATPVILVNTWTPPQGPRGKWFLRKPSEFDDVARAVGQALKRREQLESPAPGSSLARTARGANDVGRDSSAQREEGPTWRWNPLLLQRLWSGDARPQGYPGRGWDARRRGGRCPPLRVRG